MARAHAKATFACIISVVVCCTLAIGLQFSWLMWGSFICIPFIFQFAAGKAWRVFRPTIMLEYLAARAAARRYAFAANAKDLTLALMFRGKVERVFEGEEGALLALEAAIESNLQTDVWIALFTDALIMMSERPGGASLEFAHLVNESLQVEGLSPSGQGEYSSDREVKLSYTDRRSARELKFKVVSKYPASMVVFEKKLLALRREWRKRQDAMEQQESMIDQQMPIEHSDDY